MTTVQDFDIARDLKVEFYLPGYGGNSFIIGVSKIGGTDVLVGDGFVIGVSLIGSNDLLGQTTAFEWTDLACITAQATLTVGGQVQDQLYFQPEPGQANFVLQSQTVDPNYSSAFRPGTKVRVRLAKDDVDQIIWQGIVERIQATYDANGNNLLQVNAYDTFRQLMNTRLESFNSTTGYPGYISPYEQLELIAEEFGTHMNAASEDPGGQIPSKTLTDFIPSQVVYEAIQVGLGIFWIDPATQEFVFIPRPASIEPAEDTPVIGNNHGDENHLCMTDFRARSSEDAVFNSVKVSLQSNPAVSTLRKNQDSIELYGTFAADVSLNTTDLTQLNNWADRVFSQWPTAVIESVETLTKDRKGNLTQAAFMTPGQIVGVNYQEGIIDIDDYFTITKVSHFIDPDTWLTTLEVWKEA